MCFKQPQMTKQDHWLFLAREESFPLKRRWFLVAKQVSGCSSVTHSGSHHRLSRDPGISGQYEQRGSPTLIKNTLPLVFLTVTSLLTCLIPWACICMTHGVAQGGKRNRMHGGEEELLELLLPPKTLNMKLRPQSTASLFSFQRSRKVDMQQVGR